MNPVEFVLEVLSEPENVKIFLLAWKKKQTETILQSEDPFHSSFHSISPTERYSISTYHSKALVSRAQISLSQCIAILLKRHFHYTMKSIHGFVALIGRNLAGAFFFGMIYWQVATNVENEGTFVDVQNGYLTAAGTNLNTMLFATILFAIVINAVSIPAIFATNRIYYREVVRVYIMYMYVARI